MSKSVINCKIFFSRFIEVIGYTSGVVTILLAFWHEFPRVIDGYQIYGFFSLILFDTLIATILVWPKSSVSLKLSETVKANVFYGDIFSKNGIVVIPVNDYFDTIVDNQIVSSNTLHGSFINKVFSDDISDLNAQINSSLSDTKPLENNHDRKLGNKLRYPLGTVASVKKDGKIYFLVAFTRFNQNNRAEVTKAEFQQVIYSLFDYVEQYSQGFKLNVPLIGSGHSGVNIPKQKLLEFLVFAIQLNDKLTLINGVDIIILKSLKKELNLNLLKYNYSFR